MTKVPRINKYSKHKDPTTRALSNALREVFSEGATKDRFVDVARIPLICKSIIEMREDMKEVKHGMDDLRVKIENTVKKDTEQEKQEAIDAVNWDKWKDRLFNALFHALIFIILLILMRTNIINLK